MFAGFQMNTKTTEIKPSFGCSECGQVYPSALPCVCPICRAGVKHQVRMSVEELFVRKSYTHRVKPNAYRSKAIERNPEYLMNIPDMKQSIEDYENSSVQIDWLSFTFPLANLRHCTRSTKFSGIPFPTAPVLPAIETKSNEDIDSVQAFHKSIYSDYLENVLKIFIQRVLGFSYGSMTGKSFQYYGDSFLLMSDDGDTYCGQVGIGGQQDTIHFSICGAGCKHLFSSRSREFVHHWLANILGVTLLSRIDLAFDDFDGVHTCEAAERAFMVDGFKRSRGISPRFKNNDEWWLNSINEKIFGREERLIGSRQSLVYWRIYNKKLERKIDKEDFTWYRSEVELKKYTVDVLLNPAGHFVGLNEYAASILPVSVDPVRASTKSKKRVICDVLASAVQLKKQYGRVINSLLHLYENNFEKVVTSLLRDDSMLSYPSQHQILINSLE